MKVFQSLKDGLLISDACFTHAFEYMPNDVGTGRVKDLCTLVDFGDPEYEFDEGILVIVFILIESRKTSI
jgi:hypothetical protein